MAQGGARMNEIVPKLVPAAVELDKSDRVPTDEEAREALRKIGATVSTDAIRAYQTLGSWSTQLSASKMTMAVGLTDIGESEIAMKYAKELMDAARGGEGNPYGCETDPELMVSGLKMMATFMAERRQILAGMVSAEKHNREAVAGASKGKNAPPSIHQHVHLHGKQQPATP